MCAKLLCAVATVDTCHRQQFGGLVQLPCIHCSYSVISVANIVQFTKVNSVFIDWHYFRMQSRDSNIGTSSDFTDAAAVPISCEDQRRHSQFPVACGNGLHYVYNRVWDTVNTLWCNYVIINLMCNYNAICLVNNVFNFELTGLMEHTVAWYNFYY
jgi:hypothetical protein